MLIYTGREIAGVVGLRIFAHPRSAQNIEYGTATLVASQMVFTGQSTGLFLGEEQYRMSGDFDIEISRNREKFKSNFDHEIDFSGRIL
jgi:hypothetical protein